jgi:hypothetical protein
MDGHGVQDSKAVCQAAPHPSNPSLQEGVTREAAHVTGGLSRFRAARSRGHCARGAGAVEREVKIMTGSCQIEKELVLELVFVTQMLRVVVTAWEDLDVGVTPMVRTAVQLSRRGLRVIAVYSLYVAFAGVSAGEVLATDGTQPLALPRVCFAGELWPPVSRVKKKDSRDAVARPAHRDTLGKYVV